MNQQTQLMNSADMNDKFDVNTQDGASSPRH